MADLRAVTVAANLDYPIIRMDTNQGVDGLGEVRDGGFKGQRHRHLPSRPQRQSVRRAALAPVLTRAAAMNRRFMRPHVNSGTSEPAWSFSEEGTMKSRFFAVLAVAVIGVALASPLAAQTLALRANVPFEFGFAGKTMPAGEYRVPAGRRLLRAAPEQSRRARLLRWAWAFCSTASGRRTDDARITFNRYGDTYFLSTV